MATCTNCLNGMVPLEEYLIFDYMCGDCFCAFMWWMLECEEEAARKGEDMARNDYGIKPKPAAGEKSIPAKATPKPVKQSGIKGKGKK